MITQEERHRIAAELAAKISEPDSDGMTAPPAGLVRGPYVYVIHEGRVVAGLVYGFCSSAVVVSIGRQLARYPEQEAFTDKLEALAALAEEQRRALDGASADYRATCAEIVKALAEARKTASKAGPKS